MKFNNRVEIQVFLVVLLLLAAAAVALIKGGATTYAAIDEVNPSVNTSNPLAAAVMRDLAKTPQYLELIALYKKSDADSPRHRKLQALLRRLNAEALSASTIDPEKPGVQEVNCIGGDGYIHRFTSMIPQSVDTDEAYRNDMAALIARSIVEHAATDGLIPFDLPSDVQKNTDAAMEDGYAAAKKKDYLSAIGHFEKARALAPHAAEVYYNLGLAESQIPGRELRAVVWFGAFLAADPESLHALAIREQISGLNKQGLTRVIGIIAEISDQTPNQTLKDLYFGEIAHFWARAGNYEHAFQVADSIQTSDIKTRSFANIAGEQADDGDVDPALQTAGRILDQNGRSAALSNISEAFINVGNLNGAIETVSAIKDPEYKCRARRRIAAAQRQIGDKEGALKTLATALSMTEDIQDKRIRDTVKSSIAISQASAGDTAAALQTANSIEDQFNLSLAKQYIAEAQGMADDWDGAQKTLAESLEAINKAPAYSRDILLPDLSAIKARLDSRTKNEFDKENPIMAAAATSLNDWISINDTILNAPFFLDLSAYMKELPKDNESKMWEPIKDMAEKMMSAHELIGRMLKEQEKRQVPL